MELEKLQEQVKGYALNKFMTEKPEDTFVNQMLMEAIAHMINNTKNIKDIKKLRKYFVSADKEEVLKDTIEFCYGLIVERNKQLELINAMMDSRIN